LLLLSGKMRFVGGLRLLNRQGEPISVATVSLGKPRIELVLGEGGQIEL
jgi:hypothetical protein